ncbi:MAG: gamma-glutamyltransferase [Cyanobacteriota bacterium]
MKRKTKQYAIASCTREATSIGIEIASSGGNAADVAVGAAFGLIVSNVLMCSLGGGGFATIRTPDGHVETIDFFDVMPGKGLNLEYIKKYVNVQKVHLDQGVGLEAMCGHATVGVPGTAKGLELILNRYGTMPLKEIIQPSIDFAKKGTKISETIRHCIDASQKIHFRTSYGKKLLATPDGGIPEAGSILKQEDLANTLELIKHYGSDVIYKGHVAEAIVDEMQQNGGLITHKDLLTYEAIIRKPLKTSYKGKIIWTNPPPSVGGATLIELLNIVSHFKFDKNMTSKDIALLGKAQNLALKDKVTKYLDVETNEEVTKELLSSEYAAKCYKQILPSPNTTHLSAIDATGCAIGITMSMGYDSGAPIPKTGILMNNTLGEMELNPKGFLCATPGSRLTSGMAPSIMFDENKFDIVVLGSPGASRISTCLMQIILNITDFKMDLLTALSAPRFHYEGNTFAIEPGIDVDRSLLSKETTIWKFNELDMYFGGSQCVRFEKGKLPEAATDLRRSGSAQTLIR